MDMLKEQLMHLGSLVGDALTRAAAALATQDMELARQVSADDSDLNLLRFTIEETTYKMLDSRSLREPEVRLAVSSVIVSHALEHIGDSAANVAHIALRMHTQHPNANGAWQDVYTELVDMGRLAADILHSAMDAFLAGDVLLAESTVRRDRELSEGYERISAELGPVENPAVRLMLLWAAHSLQQTGVYVATICERAIFVATGELKEFR